LFGPFLHSLNDYFVRENAAGVRVGETCVDCLGKPHSLGELIETRRGQHDPCCFTVLRNHERLPCLSYPAKQLRGMRLKVAYRD
jgi:hypothetical protein